MRILYAALRHDYGDPGRGPSFEEQTFYPALMQAGHEVVPFDYFAELMRVGYEEMNRSLLRLVRKFEPDLLFCVLFEEQLDRRTLIEISERTSTTTFNWFCDDHWRFDSYSRHWAPCFNWVATTDEDAFERYHRLGFDHALMTQWACNPTVYHPRVSEPRLDVTFVGQPHSDRRRLVERLAAAGTDVTCWGQGWSGGRLTLDEMVSVFSRSRINLNFSKASAGKARQLKARPFEIAACGGFVLTENAPGLDRYFRPGEEIGTFQNGRDLVRQVERFLDDEELRASIARRGAIRARTEHTYTRRLEELFAAMGLPVGAGRESSAA
jgi:spore maturation protein CgeB